MADEKLREIWHNHIVNDHTNEMPFDSFKQAILDYEVELNADALYSRLQELISSPEALLNAIITNIMRHISEKGKEEIAIRFSTPDSINRSIQVLKHNNVRLDTINTEALEPKRCKVTLQRVTRILLSVDNIERKHTYSAFIGECGEEHLLTINKFCGKCGGLTVKE